MATRYWTIIDSSNVGLNSVATDLAVNPVNYDSSTWISTTGENYQGYTYDSVAETWTAPMVSVDELRVERDKLLREADKEFIKYISQREHNNVDRTKSTDVDEDGFTELMMYMQELRDLPRGYVPMANPIYPVFPGIYG